MIGFWVLLGVVTIMMLSILWGIIYRQHRKQPIDSDIKLHSKQIYADRFSALDNDLASHILTQTEYDQAYAELGRSFLREQDQLNSSAVSANNSHLNFIVMVVLIFVSVFSLAIYFKFGASNLLSDYWVNQQNTQKIQQEIAALGSLNNIIHQMEQKVHQQQDPQGWLLLGRLYLKAQRFDDAVDAFDQSDRLLPNQVETLVAYTQAVYFANHQQLNNKGRLLLQRVLSLAPNQLDALNLLAIDAYQRGDDAAAIQAWQKLRLQLPPESKQQQNISDMIVTAQRHLEQNIASKSLQPQLQLPVKITLADELKDKINGHEVLFIYAQAAQGSSAPLAIVKRQAKDLPITLTLDETMAMLPTATLLDVDQIRIVGRISISGKPMPQQGDLQGKSDVIHVKSHPAETIIVIDNIL